MPKFGASFASFATTTGVLTALKLVTVTKIPVEVVELAGFGGGLVAPADIQHSMTAAPVSAAGAGTGAASPPTPEPMGANKTAAASSFLWKMTAEPTTYGSVFPILISFNQRGGMRWAVPKGEGYGNVFENTSMHIGFRVQSSAVGTVDGYLQFWE